MIAKGTIPGRAGPWQAPTLGRNGGVNHSARNYARYKQWLRTVADFAALSKPRGGPYLGPVVLRLVVYRRPRPGAGPDATNLQKAIEDGLQGVIYGNDRQVREVHSIVRVDATEAERVEFEVAALEHDIHE